MPIQGLPSSNQQEAYGASGGIISTGFEKKLNRDKIAPEIAAGAAPFKNILINMVNPEDTISEVKKKDEKNELEQTLLQNKMLEKIAEHHASGIRKKIGSKHEEARTEVAEMATEGKTLSPEEKAKLLEEAFLKDYIALAAKWIVGRPAEDMESVRIMIGAVKKELIAGGLTVEALKYIDQKTLDMIKEAVLHLIKDKFYSSLDRPLELIELILNSTKSQSIVEFLTSFEEDAFVVGRYAKEFDIKDLTQIAVALNINIDAWMKELKVEKIKIENIEKIDEISISFRFEEISEVRDVSNMITTYRRSQIEIFMSDNLIEKIRITIENISLVNKLLKNGVSKEEISELKTQARRIAWLKIVSNLKMSHLNRILSISSKQFDAKSKEIARLTRKTQRLGYDIPKEGISWIKKGLERLALETAEYKIELLMSLQKISYEKEKEKDIVHLKQIVSKIKSSSKRRIFNFNI